MTLLKSSLSTLMLCHWGLLILSSLDIDFKIRNPFILCLEVSGVLTFETRNPDRFEITWKNITKLRTSAHSKYLVT